MKFVTLKSHLPKKKYKMIFEKNLILSRENKKPIVYDVCFTSSKGPKPIVIFCHGYKGFKDWGAWNLVAEAFAREGFFFLKFNFSHNGGTIDQPIDFPDLEAFGQNNFSLELDDLDSIINLLRSTDKYEKIIDLENITLTAHSRGGGIVLIKAEENNIIKTVITWAGVSDFGARFQENSEVFKKWEETGITHIENGRTKQQMPHYFQFYKNFKANEGRLTIKRAVGNLIAQQLIIHGTEDSSVVLSEAQNLHKWNPKSKLELIENADHVFGACHPWDESELPLDLSKVINQSIAFIKNNKF